MTYASAQAHYENAAHSTEAAREQLFVVFFFDCDGFQVLGFEDLTAFQTFHVVYAVAPRDHLGPAVLASGLHKGNMGLF